jgi:hypothetical protein
VASASSNVETEEKRIGFRVPLMRRHLFSVDSNSDISPSDDSISYSPDFDNESEDADADISKARRVAQGGERSAGD